MIYILISIFVIAFIASTIAHYREQVRFNKAKEKSIIETHKLINEYCKESRKILYNRHEIKDKFFTTTN